MDICAEISVMFDSPVVMMKRSKRGERECDISPLVKNAAAEYSDGALKVTVITSAAGENYLNPEYAAKAIEKQHDLSGKMMFHTITRKSLILSDG